MGLKRNTDFHMSIEEIADQLGLEKRQIKNTLDSAIKKLRNRAQKIGIEGYLDQTIFRTEQRQSIRVD